jgi:hypothetical protein
MVKSISGSINSMRDSLNTLNFAAKEARQVSLLLLSPPLLSLPRSQHAPPLSQEANNRISAINTRISSISATAAQQSQVNALQAVVAKLAADQHANDARVSAAMQDIYASIRLALPAHVNFQFLPSLASQIVSLVLYQAAARHEDDSWSQG